MPGDHGMLGAEKRMGVEATDAVEILQISRRLERLYPIRKRYGVGSGLNRTAANLYKSGAVVRLLRLAI